MIAATTALVEIVSVVAYAIPIIGTALFVGVAVVSLVAHLIHSLFDR